MKTLMNEIEVYNVHRGDTVSARTVVKIGRLHRKGLKFYRCADKIIFLIDTCPHCISHNTFHKRAMKKKNVYDNVYKYYSVKSSHSKLFHKIDYCLDCHKEFSIEMFCYERLGFFEGLFIWLVGEEE